MPLDNQLAPVDPKKLKELLEQRAALYNRKEFIAKDPVSVPHRFSKMQDIEIAGLFAAILAWGNRTTIINNANRIMELMDEAPYDFLLNHQENDLKKFMVFAHRTFNATDLLYFIYFLQDHYQRFDSLEDAFVPLEVYTLPTIEQALVHFHHYFFSIEHPERTRKHISTPSRNSACKRLCMYLRWMVRSDKCGVDFGIWKKISPAQLVCPLDVHVARVAKRLQLLPDEKSNWKNALLLTKQLSAFDANDPARYDFALFGLGAEERL